MGQTFAEKIFAKKAKVDKVSPGEIVTLSPDVVMTLDADAEIMYRFQQLGIKKVWVPERIACFLDHYAPASTLRTATLHKRLRDFAREQGIAKDKFEFQMLYGIRPDLQKSLIREGYRMRVYIPYGRDWFPYFMRRLAERPANLLFIMKNLFR